jgi:hypothetical protein
VRVFVLSCATCMLHAAVCGTFRPTRGASRVVMAAPGRTRYTYMGHGNWHRHQTGPRMYRRTPLTQCSYSVLYLASSYGHAAACGRTNGLPPYRSGHSTHYGSTALWTMTEYELNLYHVPCRISRSHDSHIDRIHTQPQGYHDGNSRVDGCLSPTATR